MSRAPVGVRGWDEDRITGQRMPELSLLTQHPEGLDFGSRRSFLVWAWRPLGRKAKDVLLTGWRPWEKEPCSLGSAWMAMPGTLISNGSVTFLQLQQGSANFFIKAQIISILGIVGNDSTLFLWFYSVLITYKRPQVIYKRMGVTVIPKNLYKISWQAGKVHSLKTHRYDFNHSSTPQCLGCLRYILSEPISLNVR